MRLLLLIPILLAAVPARAEPLVFDGRVEAMQRAELSSRLDGVVTEILFSGGESVMAGTPMIVLDDADAKSALAAAEAEVLRAETDARYAKTERDRIETLKARGIATGVKADAAAHANDLAIAALRLAETARERARLDLERTVIRAAIDGTVLRPITAVGAFVEAESGAPLGEILQLDPILVSYRVPYEVRLQSMRRAGAESIEELFARIEIEVRLAGGHLHPHRGRPEIASATVDPDSSNLTVWAVVPNPGLHLRPGMRVSVTSIIGGEAMQ